MNAGWSVMPSMSRSQRGPDTLGAAARPAPGGTVGGQRVQMRERLVVESQDAAQRLEHLRRRMPVAALLEPHEVVDADPGQQRQLLAPEAGRAAAGALGQPDLGRGDQLAPGTDEVTEGVVHP